jgi:hypothetical protein
LSSVATELQSISGVFFRSESIFAEIKAMFSGVDPQVPGVDDGSLFGSTTSAVVPGLLSVDEAGEIRAEELGNRRAVIDRPNSEAM